MSSIEIRLPAEALGEEGDATLESWAVTAGAMVSEGQLVAEMRTSKAIVEIVSPAAGKLEHGVAAGAVVLKDGVIGYVHV